MTKFGPVGHEEPTRQASRRRSWTAWPPVGFGRYRVMTLIPLVALAGMAIAGLAGIAGIIDPSVNGSGCCPPH